MTVKLVKVKNILFFDLSMGSWVALGQTRR